MLGAKFLRLFALETSERPCLREAGAVEEQEEVEGRALAPPPPPPPPRAA